MKKTLTITIAAIGLCCCTKHTIVHPGQNDKYDAIHFLIKDRDFSEKELDSLAEVADSLCGKEIIVSERDFTNLIQKADALIQRDSLLQNHFPEHDYLKTTTRELSFRLLVKTQEGLKQAFNNRPGEIGESHYSKETNTIYSFRQNVSELLPFIQANDRFSQAKTEYLLNAIESLDEIETPHERLRRWISIDRMLEHIDLVSSEFGDEVHQRSARGIFTKPGQIWEMLNEQVCKENDLLVQQKGEEIVAKVAEHFDSQIGPEFQFAVRAAKERKEWFETEKQRKVQEDAGYLQQALEAKSDSQRIYFYSKSLEENPNDVISLNNRGIALQNSGRYDEALHDFTKAISLDSHYDKAFYNRALLHERIGDYQKAVQDFTKAIELYPIQDQAFENRGNAFLKLGDYTKALEDYHRALMLNPHSLSVLMNRGDIYRKLKDYRSAIQDYSSVILKLPRNTSALNNRGICHRELKEFNKALVDHKRAIELAPESPTSYYNLGCVYWGMKNWHAVIEAWQKCLALNPKHSLARKYLPEAEQQLKNN